MTETKFTRRDTLFFLACVLIATISLCYLSANYHRAFPEYNIKFNVDRATSIRLAQNFLTQLGWDLNGYRHAVVFEIDEQSKTFLERELGPEGSNEILQEHFPVWHWSNRWFKPLSPEEFLLKVTPQGKIVAFEHTLPEEAAAPSLTEPQTRQLCHEFLATQLHLSLADWEFVEYKSEHKPHRVDYLFTYQKKNAEIHGATERLDFTIQGNRLGAFRHYLKLPEPWLRNYHHLRSLNTTTALGAQALMMFLLIAILIVFVKNSRRKQIAWKSALIFGILAFCLQLVSRLNSLPLEIFDFDTNQTLSNYYGSFLLSALLSSLILGILVVIITGAAESVNSQSYPGQVALRKMFTPAGLRTKHFFISTILGLTLAVGFMAFQTFFYLTASRHGAWAPVEVAYSDVLNTALPWVFVLLSGFAPAVLEEFTFRMFAIPYLSRLIRSRLLAILIPAIIWGFAHANYPNQPFWIRGVEVSFFGIIVGIIFLKMNILALLVWHYTVDAIYSAFLMVRVGSPYFVITAGLSAGILLLPLLYNLCAYFKRKSFEPTQNLTYQYISPVEPSIKTPLPQYPFVTEERYTPMTAWRRKSAFGLVIVLSFILLLPVNRIGEFQHYPVSKSKIVERARSFLQESGIDDKSFLIAIELRQKYEPLMGKYGLAYTSPQRLNAILEKDLKNSVVWQLRFFKPNTKEEFQLSINPATNEVIEFEHLLDDDAIGENLTPKAAQRRIAEFLQHFGYDLQTLILVENTSQKQKHRTDYDFTYETKEGTDANIQQGRLRLNLSLKGGKVARLNISYKLPEEWRLQQTQRSTLQIIGLTLQIVALFFIAGLAIFLINRRLHERQLNLKPLKRLAFAMALLALLYFSLRYESDLITYRTSWSLMTYQIVWSILTLLKTVGIYGIVLLCGVIIAFCYPTDTLRQCSENWSAYSFDAIIASLLAISGVFALTHLASFGLQHLYPPALAENFSIPSALESRLPLIDSLFSISLMTITVLAALALFSFIWNNWQIGQWQRFLIVLALLAIFQIDTCHSWLEFWAASLPALMIITWLYFCFHYFLRNNYLAYFYTAVGFIGIRQIFLLWKSRALAGELTAALLILMLGAAILLINKGEDTRFKQLFIHDNMNSMNNL